MSIALIVTGGYGNGTLSGDIAHIVTRGYEIGTEVSLWSAASTSSSLWYAQNPAETTWDSGTTFWDLDGNVYQTLWDNIDETWADQTGNSVTWTDQ